MKKLIIALFMMFCAYPATAATYYVSADGNDANSGLSYANRWATIQKACDTAVAGDTTLIYDDGGIFYSSGGSFIGVAKCNTSSGTADNLIIFESAPGETPILEPAETVTSWTNISGNIWESNIFTTNNNTSATQLWKDTTILTYSGASCASGLDAEGKYCMCSPSSSCTSSGRVRIYTTINPNSFVYRAATAGSGGNPDYGFWIDGKQYIKVIGLKVQYSDIGFEVGGGGNNNTLEDITSEHAYNIGIAFNNASGAPLSSGFCNNCHAYYTGTTLANQSEHGIKGKSSILGVQSGGLIIDGGEFAYNNWHGIQISEGWDNVIVRNVYSHDNNLENNSDGSDIRVGNQTTTPLGSQIYHNICANTKYGINIFAKVDGTRIWGNTITGSTVAGLQIESGVINLLGDNIVVHSNVIRDNTGVGVLITIHNDNFKFFNNTIDNNTGSAVRIKDFVTGGLLENNAISAPTGSLLIEAEPGAIFTSNYNAFYSPDASPFSYNGSTYNFAAYKVVSSQDANSIFSDFTSEFNNYAGNDFSIGANSTSLKDAGLTISDVPYDFNALARPQGNAYAIGAYEEPAVSSNFRINSLILDHIVVD